MSLPYKSKLIPKAKELRKNMTPQERHLWYDFLRSYPVRFQRQKAIGTFIVDFYCHSAKLIVEIDGSQHFSVQGSAYDAQRTKQLEEYSVAVIRFSNYDVNTNFDGVCMEIDRVVMERLEQIPDSLKDGVVKIK